jgi:hypothetical protein
VRSVEFFLLDFYFFIGTEQTIPKHLIVILGRQTTTTTLIDDDDHRRSTVTTTLIYQDEEVIINDLDSDRPVPVVVDRPLNLPYMVDNYHVLRHVGHRQRQRQHQ